VLVQDELSKPYHDYERCEYGEDRDGVNRGTNDRAT